MLIFLRNWIVLDMRLLWRDSSDFTESFSREICVDKFFGFSCDVIRQIVFGKSFYLFAFFWFVVGDFSFSFGNYVAYVDVLSIAGDFMDDVKWFEICCVYGDTYFFLEFMSKCL